MAPHNACLNWRGIPSENTIITYFFLSTFNHVSWKKIVSLAFAVTNTKMLVIRRDCTSAAKVIEWYLYLQGCNQLEILGIDYIHIILQFNSFLDICHKTYMFWYFASYPSNNQLYFKEIILSTYCIHKLFCHNIVIQIKFKIVKRIRCLYLKKEIQMCM